MSAGQPAQASGVTVTNQGGNVAGKVVNESGAGIAGVIVTLTKGDSVTQAKTGEDGTFHISDLMAGEYTVQFEKEGYVTPAQTTITVTAGGTATVAQQAMQNAMGTISGTVKDLSGAAVGNATVTLRGCRTKDSDRRYTVKADAAGTFRIQVIEDTYQILAATEGAAVQGVSEII